MRTTPSPWIRIARALCVAGALAASPAARAQQCGLPPGTPIFGLTADNRLMEYSLNLLQPPRQVGASFNQFTTDETIVGMDFRPADPDDTALYVVTDRGDVKRTSAFPGMLRSLLTTTTVSTLSTLPSPIPFQGGAQSLVDFNPMLDAIRLIGSNDQNIAIVTPQGGALLSAFAVQTALRYVSGDLAQGMDPQITAGAYDNNFPGAARTTFYMLDYAQDTLVTIADRNPVTGSSNTGNGMLKTIGKLVDSSGRPLNVAPTAGIDIVTLASGKNVLVGYLSRKLFCIDLSTVNPDLPPGTTPNVPVTPIIASPFPVNNGFGITNDALIDVAVPSRPPVSADLSATVARNAGNVSSPMWLGDPLVFDVKVRNNGPSIATGVKLSVTATQSNVGKLDVTSISPAIDCAPVNTGDKTQVSCVLPSLVSGGQVTFTLTVRTIRPATQPAQTVTLTTVGTASGDVPDPNANNNTGMNVTNLTF